MVSKKKMNQVLNLTFILQDTMLIPRSKTCKINYRGKVGKTPSCNCLYYYNKSSSVLDAEMTTIRVALENASETRDKITMHTDFLTVVTLLSNRKLDLNTITRAIRDAASRLTQRLTI